MAMNISAGAIRNPIPPIVLILALLFAGLTAYFRLPINQLPNIEFPVFTVSVTRAGAAPAELETQITQRVEAALAGVEGVKRITSTVSPGVSTTTVELQLNADLSRAVDDARDAMTRVRVDLPADIDEPVIQRMEAAAEPIAYYALRGDGMSDQDLSWFIDNDLSRDLLAVPGISQVTRMGGVDREIRVELNPERLIAYGLTPDGVSTQLRSINADLPGGQAQVGGQAQTIRTLGSADTVRQLAETRLIASNGAMVRLGDLGDVNDGASEISSISRFNGAPAVTFMVQRSKGSSEVHVYDAMEAKMREIAEANPNVHLELIFTPVDFIKGMHESSMSALIEGALLACVVVFLILRDWRATLIAAAAIPLAVIPTFAVMEPLGFTLNMITLIALALVAGVLVDDAIVEIENIVRHMRMGKKPFDAALEAADEIGLAVVATAATIIAVFVPVSFMTGQTGQFFKEFGLTVAIATFFSLVVARLITPMMAAYFLKDNHHEEKSGALMDVYHATLGFAIRRPGIVAILGGLTFVISIFLFTKVPMAFIPRIDGGSVQVSVEVPPGTPLVEADRVVQQMATRLATVPETSGIFTSTSGVSGAASSASITVLLKERNERNKSSYEVQQSLRPLLTEFPDYRTSFQNFQGGGRGADVTIKFVGQDPQAVREAGDRLVAAMHAIPQLADIRSSAAMQRPEIRVTPRTDDAARLGVSSSSLASAVRVATSGDVDQSLARFNLSDRQIPIRVLLRQDSRQNLDMIRAIPVQSSLGAPVRLDAVADVSFGLGEAQAERRDRQRAVTVTANVTSGEIGTAVAQVFDLPAAKNPPPGVALVAAGDTEEMQEMIGSFITAMIWGILLIYGVLVLLFKDFFQPITIMTALPLSLFGALLGLLICNQPLSMFALIGLLMLMGIVTKNSILLVDFAVEQMHRGMSRNQALMEAGLKRARPILMTTFAMAAGMIPAAAGWGVDGSLRQGMGIAVISGLMLSTVLSLVFVPAMFVLIDRLERWFWGLFRRRGEEPSPAPHAAE